MRLVADESVEAETIQQLRSAHFDVLSIAETSPGFKDHIVLEKAHSLGALLLTEDKDFGDLVFRLRKPHHGIVLVRLPNLNGAPKARIVLKALQDFSAEMKDAFTVISKETIRIRKP